LLLSTSSLSLSSSSPSSPSTSLSPLPSSSLSSMTSCLSGGSSYTGGCTAYMLSLTGLTPTTNDQVIPGGYYLMPEMYKVKYSS